MKKLLLITPLALLLSMFSFNGNLEAAGCSAHKNKNKNVKVECSLSDDNCESYNLDKKSTKAEA